MSQYREDLDRMCREQNQPAMRDGPCFYCGEATSSLAGNPGLWPLQFCQPDGTGITRFHHTSCVVDRLRGDPLAGRALSDIAAERYRQMRHEGWMPDHDDEHRNCELATAAACYATAPSIVQIEREPVPPDTPKNWPWHFSWWKPGTYRRNLVKAGALIVAEIERWDRASPLTRPNRDTPEAK